MNHQFQGVNRIRQFFTFNQVMHARNTLHLAAHLERCGVEDWELERAKVKATSIIRDYEQCNGK